MGYFFLHLQNPVFHIVYEYLLRMELEMDLIVLSLILVTKKVNERLLMADLRL